jgi:hypothetical protein
VTGDDVDGDGVEDATEDVDATDEADEAEDDAHGRDDEDTEIGFTLFVDETVIPHWVYSQFVHLPDKGPDIVPSRHELAESHQPQNITEFAQASHVEYPAQAGVVEGVGVIEGQSQMSLRRLSRHATMFGSRMFMQVFDAKHHAHLPCVFAAHVKQSLANRSQRTDDVGLGEGVGEME